MLPARLRSLLPVILLCAPSLAAQSSHNSGSGDTLMTPAQLRQVGPPEESMTPEQLEVRADELRLQKSYADALDYYNAAIRKKETSSLHNKAGIAQLQLLRHSEAKKSFQRALKLDKKNAEARNNLGVIYYIQQNYGRAVKEYKRAIEARGDSPSFYSNLGTAEFSRKKYQQASDAYLKALELDPEIFERRSMAGVQMHMASPADRAGYHYTIAKMFATRGDAERCLLYLRKAVEEGYPEINRVYKDAEFAVVRDDPRFAQLMQRRDSLAPPQ